MQIELIGCTSSGKSTLAKNIRQVYRGPGNLVMGKDFVLQTVRLNWIKNNLIRIILVDLAATFACIATWQRHLDFYVFAIQVIRQLPVNWLEKLNLVRNIFKKIGIYEIVHHYSSNEQVILVDEGTLQAAHNLFVHASVQTTTNDLSTFVKLTPLPDIAIYVTQSEQVLIERTILRGHKRIPNNSYAKIECFIKRAVDTFSRLSQYSAIKKILLVVDGQKNTIISQRNSNNPLMTEVFNVINAGQKLHTDCHNLND